MENNQNKGGLNKSLKLIFVYTVATGSIFTFVNYWDSVFLWLLWQWYVPGICSDDCCDSSHRAGVQRVGFSVPYFRR